MIISNYLLSQILFIKEILLNYCKATLFEQIFIPQQWLGWIPGIFKFSVAQKYFPWNTPKSRFSHFKIDHVFFLEMSNFLMFENLEIPRFLIWFKNHVIGFEMGKGPKMNWFDFGAFQDFRAYALTCKSHPLHVFWGISRNLP